MPKSVLLLNAADSNAILTVPLAAIASVQPYSQANSNGSIVGVRAGAGVKNFLVRESASAIMEQMLG